MAQIIVMGWIDFEAGVREQWLQRATDMMAVTRLEPGCITYVLVADPLIDNRVRIFEQWESQEALDGHVSSTHVREFGAEVAGLKGIASSVGFYDATKRKSPRA